MEDFKSPKQETLQDWFNSDFHKNTESLMRKFWEEKYPNGFDDIEFEFFYYKLGLLRQIANKSVTSPDATDEMQDYMIDSPLSADEFEEIKEMLLMIREADPDSQSVISDEVLAACDTMIAGLDNPDDKVH